ncbi:olfactory receptor 688-like [Xenopus tropicalis]|uniref:Olfactory receptor n=2 Tax=Xenopus tropicalis TaxID=8364 RepID=A0A6I8Q2J2_XENTR|nr:olfactory receptor 688-like [Xenopus tropicalis]
MTISMPNETAVTEFILLGFPGLQPNFFLPVSLTLFLAYIVSLIANSTVIILIILREQLHQPMYIIIANLALSDLLYDTITLPKIIAKYWFGAGSISFNWCFFQIYCVHHLGCLDSLIIMLMAIDRYVAICHPLRYHSIISNKLATLLCYFLWPFAALNGLAMTLISIQVPYCGPNRVKNCFCASQFLIVLACVDVALEKKKRFIIIMCVHLSPFIVIILSYILIIRVVHLSTNNENWQKAFYTCTTHLLVIGLYFIPRLFLHVINQYPLILDADANVLIVCLYTFIPHLASPIIFCLRTKEIRNNLRQMFNSICPRAEHRPRTPGKRHCIKFYCE